MKKQQKLDVIRAWKDEAYRASLSEEQLAQLPASPAGAVEINEDYLRGVTGGDWNSTFCCSLLCSDSCCDHACP